MNKRDELIDALTDDHKRCLFCKEFLPISEFMGHKFTLFPEGIDVLCHKCRAGFKVNKQKVKFTNG